MAYGRRDDDWIEHGSGVRPRAADFLAESLETEKKDIPFIMLTAEAYRENILAATQLGVSDYVAKPFTPETLGNKVRDVLDKTYNKK